MSKFGSWLALASNPTHNNLEKSFIMIMKNRSVLVLDDDTGEEAGSPFHLFLLFSFAISAVSSAISVYFAYSCIQKGAQL